MRRLLELIRFSHTVFALPFALSSAALAWRDEPFRWPDLVGILLGMVLARSAGMAFNRLADRDIDARNPRTAKRHLPAGTLSAPASACSRPRVRSRSSARRSCSSAASRRTLGRSTYPARCWPCCWPTR